MHREHCCARIRGGYSNTQCFMVFDNYLILQKYVKLEIIIFVIKKIYILYTKMLNLFLNFFQITGIL